MEIVISKNMADLKKLERIVENNIMSFHEIGMALAEIRDRQLYRDVLQYETFEAYCKARWDFGKWYAYKLIDSAAVVEALDNCPIKPSTESQARPLTKLEPPQQLIAWQRAVETAPEGKVTAAHVQKVVKEMTKTTRPPLTPDPPPELPEHAVYFAKLAIYQLERIEDSDPSKAKALDMVINWVKKHR